MAAEIYILDTEETISAFWSHNEQDSSAAFELSEQPWLRPALCAERLPGVSTQVFDVLWIRRFNSHPAVSDEDRALQRSSDTEDWLNLTGDLDNPNL